MHKIYPWKVNKDKLAMGAEMLTDKRKETIRQTNVQTERRGGKEKIESMKTFFNIRKRHFRQKVFSYKMI